MSTKGGIQIIGAAKQTIREYKSSKNPFIRCSVSSLVFCWNALLNLKRLFVDTEFRSVLLLQIFNSKNVHQTTPLTYMDRYPKIFSACSDYFGDKKDLKILSFGCSTGEEVLTLRKYFPSAHIVGADINKRSIAICRRLPVDEKITFVHSSDSEIQKHGPFDAVFCMAVLQRKPHYIAAKGISSIKKIYPFEKFEKQIIELDGLLKKQGILTVHFTQYSLRDTSVAFKYEALGNYNQNDYRSPVFDRNSQIVKNPSLQNSIFIKSRK
ncbi:class I SAM-dependent methyltransferase [Metabacillus halosaccharovorans]|uniref:class I SAM-dependent methyltransferase n=1 Tax=Metabacillus halosaccharovorans TaxID=930124 RepID=UPI001C200E3D|nr:class I SAM-dependent methyltransferase [Metabacillus halosaccharovorans]MBU7593503.1 class I SAM-dependent methyltransferase [Metabacillus halosaccharovorans]